MKSRNLLFAILTFISFNLNGQVKLHLDSSLVVHYKKVYRINNNRLLIPFYCDPFYEHLYKKTDTLKLCGKFVFVDSNMNLKIKPFFDLPCWFNPYFQENLCAVSVQNELVYIDTLGNIADLDSAGNLTIKSSSLSFSAATTVINIGKFGRVYR